MLAWLGETIQDIKPSMGKLGCMTDLAYETELSRTSSGMLILDVTLSMFFK